MLGPTVIQKDPVEPTARPDMLSRCQLSRLVEATDRHPDSLHLVRPPVGHLRATVFAEMAQGACPGIVERRVGPR